MIKNLKKAISTIAAVAIIASSASAFAVSFPDVEESASYANAVETLVGLGIVNGDENGKFNPDNTVTRAEFAKMVVEALGEGAAAASSTYTKFADSQGHWGAGYIEAGVGKGFINGYDDNTFGPDDTVTYAQAVKMLVAAIGYTTWAEQQGGWPSGYLAFGSSLEIINGVTGVTNDTALTRAQCAVLVNNTLKAPMVEIKGYTAGGLSGNVLTPNLVQMDGNNRDYPYYHSLLTEKHDAYAVKGRVVTLSKGNSTYKADEVQFSVEVADNFDGKEYGSTANAPTSKKMSIGTTNADEMLFEYAEAVVVKDTDTEKYTILSINAYGESDTVELQAKDYNTYTALTAVTNAKIEFDKSETSSLTDKYELATWTSTDNAGNVTRHAAAMYVNGIYVGEANKTNVETYIKGNNAGTVTLVDATDEGSTATDGVYDYVMVSYYKTVVVDSVSAKSDRVKVLAKNGSGSNMAWELDNDDVTVKITMDGEEVSYEDLQEYDVLSVAYNPTAAFANSDFYEVAVSRNKVTGTISGKDPVEGSVTVDGTEYDVVYELTNIGTTGYYTLGKEYELYTDVFGNIQYYVEGTANKKVGVVVAMYKGAADDYHTVRMINADGEVVEYEAYNDPEALEIYNYVKGTSLTAFNASSPEKFSKSDVKNTLYNNVIEYKISDGKIKMESGLTKRDAVNAEYKESTSKLGDYTIDKTSTRVLDLDGYINDGTDPAVYDIDNLSDGSKYTAYAYDKSVQSGIYGFVIITAGTSSIKADDAFAVVTSVNGQTTVNDETVISYTVARAGEEDIEIAVEGDTATAAEGSIVTYAVGSKGYVKRSNFNVLYTPADNAGVRSYDALYNSVIGAADTAKVFSSVLGSWVDGSNVIQNMASNDEVKLYFGPVFKASSTVLELFTSKGADNKTSVNATEDFTLAGANVYTYDYAVKQNKGRVSVGNSTQTDSTYTELYDSADKNYVVWTKNTATVDAEPMFAFVKTVDGDTADVVYFVPTF